MQEIERCYNCNRIRAEVHPGENGISGWLCKWCAELLELRLLVLERISKDAHGS